MSLYSKADLRDDVLVELGVLDPSENPQGSTIARVDPIIQQVIEYLADENCLIFDSSVGIQTKNIPGRIMRSLVALMALELQPGFGRGKATPDEKFVAMRNLRRSILEGSNDIPTVIENF